MVIDSYHTIIYQRYALKRQTLFLQHVYSLNHIHLLPFILQLKDSSLALDCKNKPSKNNTPNQFQKMVLQFLEGQEGGQLIGKYSQLLAAFLYV